MAKIQPITSEEVLERQVRESIEAAPQPATSSPHSEVASSTAGQSSAVTSAVTTDTSNKVTPSVVAAPKESKEPRSGFNYRLPLGVYVIAYNYIVIALAAFTTALFSTILYLQGETFLSSGALWVAIEESRSLWIVSIVSTVIYLSLLSARSLARWAVILVCSGIAIYGGVQLFRVFSSIPVGSSDITLGSSFVMTSLFYAMLPLFAVMGLTLSTVVYLLRSKIAAIYE